MSKIDENQIEHRLKILSQIKPVPESTNRAIQRVRDTLINKEREQQSSEEGTRLKIFKSSLTKFAAAAVLLLAVGYATGRLSAPPPPDMEALRAALEPALRQDLLEQMNERWQTAFAANRAQLKDELQQQVRRDLTEFATQTLAASGTLTNQRLMELVELIEAARRRERMQVAAALEQMEFNRQQLENGLLTVAARTSELRRTEQ